MKGVQNTVKRPESFSRTKLLVVESASLISVVMLSVWLLVHEYHVLFH
jgi:hypothetical protein